MDDDVELVKSPRLCTMAREENGYGFNLHGEKGVVGQYISAVDPGGPADKVGVCVGDRVIEVNGMNVEAFSHAEVVSSIRGNPNQTSLLVIDKITDNYLKKIGQSVTSDLIKYSSVCEIFESHESSFNAENQLEDDDLEMKIADTNNIDIVNNDEPSENSEDLVEGFQMTPSELPSTEHVSSDAFPTYETVSQEILETVTQKVDSPDVSTDQSKKDEADDAEYVQATEDYAEMVDRKDSTIAIISPDQARPTAVPKRKQVKQTKADWKAKQDLFNNL